MDRCSPRDPDSGTPEKDVAARRISLAVANSRPDLVFLAARNLRRRIRLALLASRLEATLTRN